MPVFRDEAARDWLQRCVALFCQERGLQYVQVEPAPAHRLSVGRDLKGGSISRGERRAVEARDDVLPAWQLFRMPIVFRDAPNCSLNYHVC